MHAADPPVRARVVNLSCGGAAITDLPVAMRVEPGMQLQPCRLTFDDDDEPLVATFDVVRVADVPHAHGPTARLVGIQFVDLPAGDRARIQRFITGLQREDIARVQAVA